MGESGSIIRNIALILLFAVMGASHPALAQVQTGNLYGTAVDSEGNALPGVTVTVTVTDTGAPRIQITDAQGQFRFLELDPGNYGLKAQLNGFSTVAYPKVNIRVGSNTTIETEPASRSVSVKMGLPARA